MKNRYYILILIASFSLLLSSCGSEFLDRVPQGSYTDADFYSSPAALKAATAPLYTRAWFEYNQRAALAIGSCRANDVYGRYFLTAYPEFTVTSLFGELQQAWRGYYGVVTMANETLVAIQTKTTGVTEEEKVVAMAECRLMRGVAYFYMLRTWGPVILFEDNSIVVDNPLQPLHKEEDVLQFIINDLTYAAKNLPGVADKGRATSWAAKGLLAKAYLARSGWNKGGTRDQADLDLAILYASDVCDNSGIKLYENYEDLFKYKHNNNPESLLAMQWVPSGDWGVCNTLLSDLAFSSDVTGGVMAWGSSGASIDMLKQYERNDKRLDATFFTQNAHYSYINIKDGGYTYEGTSAPIKKGVPGGPDDDNDGHVKVMNSPLNTYILRLADVYLTYAEAALGNNASLSSGPGLAYFNLVRTRAGLPAKTQINLDDIIRERRVEFAAEYCNWYDMVSWYRYQPEKMLAYFNNQERGWASTKITRNEVGDFDFGTTEPDGGLSEPTIPVEIRHDNIFLPYPEGDVLQNPLLKEPPVDYVFNEE